jgi:hypothetical protein
VISNNCRTGPVRIDPVGICMLRFEPVCDLLEDVGNLCVADLRRRRVHPMIKPVDRL